MKDLFQYHHNFLCDKVRSAKLPIFIDGLEQEVRKATSLSPTKSLSHRPGVISVLLTEDPAKFNYLSFPLPHYRAILKLMECVNRSLKCALNSCVVNYYSSHKSQSKPHSDDEPYIDQSEPICTFSIGASRNISIHEKSVGAPLVLEQLLEDGSLHVMLPGSQKKPRIMFNLVRERDSVYPSVKSQTPNLIQLSGLISHLRISCLPLQQYPKLKRAECHHLTALLPKRRTIVDSGHHHKIHPQPRPVLPLAPFQLFLV